MHPKANETFTINDRRSIRQLSKNEVGQENSAPAYFWFTLKLLRQNKG